MPLLDPNHNDPFSTPPRAARSLQSRIDEAAAGLANDLADLSESGSDSGMSVLMPGNPVVDVSQVAKSLFDTRVEVFLNPDRPKRGREEKQQFVPSDDLLLMKKVLLVKETTKKLAKRRRDTVMALLTEKKLELNVKDHDAKYHIAEVWQQLDETNMEVTNNERAMFFTSSKEVMNEEKWERDTAVYTNKIKVHDRTIAILDKDRTNGMALVDDLNKKVIKLESSLAASEAMSNKRKQALSMFTFITKSATCDVCYETIGYKRQSFHVTLCNHVLCNTCHNKNATCYWHYCVERDAMGDIIVDPDGHCKPTNCSFAYKTSAVQVLDDIFEMASIIGTEFANDVGARLDDSKTAPCLITDFQENKTNVRTAAYRRANDRQQN
ncbi:hypothetical protein T484DRAFT_1756960 [Baffinella frigidus]|nr:hypothetical protein T484DRAFT_1756960 [Cryptophyta sp. CCMP2293]